MKSLYLLAVVASYSYFYFQIMLTVIMNVLESIINSAELSVRF